MEISEIKENELYLYTQSNGISKKVRALNVNVEKEQVNLIVEDEGHSDNGMEKHFNKIECHRYLSELIGNERSFEEQIKVYQNTVCKATSYEDRLERINNFRCGNYF